VTRSHQETTEKSAVVGPAFDTVLNVYPSKLKSIYAPFFLCHHPSKVKNLFMQPFSQLFIEITSKKHLWSHAKWSLKLSQMKTEMA
jgi:hypothetical protein